MAEEIGTVYVRPTRERLAAAMESASLFARMKGDAVDNEVLAAEVSWLQVENRALSSLLLDVQVECIAQTQRANAAVQELGSCEAEFRKPLRDEIAKLKAEIEDYKGAVRHWSANVNGRADERDAALVEVARLKELLQISKRNECKCWGQP